MWKENIPLIKWQFSTVLQNNLFVYCFIFQYFHSKGFTTCIIKSSQYWKIFNSRWCQFCQKIMAQNVFTSIKAWVAICNIALTTIRCIPPRVTAFNSRRISLLKLFSIFGRWGIMLSVIRSNIDWGCIYKCLMSNLPSHFTITGKKHNCLKRGYGTSV